MKKSDPWQQLVVLARTAAPTPLPAADPDDDARFAARVISRHFVPTPSPAYAPSWRLPWETWSLRGMAAAGAMAAVMLAWNFSLLSPDSLPDDVIPPDSVAELAAAF